MKARYLKIIALLFLRKMGEVVDLRRWRKSLESMPFNFVYNAYKESRDCPCQNRLQEVMCLTARGVLAQRPVGQRLRFFYSLLRQKDYALANCEELRVSELENDIFEYNMHILG
jgi:hypothetical protein